MRICSFALAAIALPVVGGVRHARHSSAAKTIAGVPVFNYEKRHLQPKSKPKSKGSSANVDYDWFLAFDKTSTDAQLNHFCKHYVGKAECIRMGHPDAHGTPYVMIRSDEDTFKFVLEANSGQIVFAEPDLPVKVPDIVASHAEIAGPGFGDDWHLKRVGLPDSEFTGEGVHIFVLDTGVRTTHEEFGGRAIPTLDTFQDGWGSPVECEGDANCASDSHGHGTHVAGTAGGKTYGAAPKSHLYAMKVCCGWGTNIAGGLDFATISDLKPRIITMSLGMPGVSEAARVLVNTAVDKGVTVFVAAGNDDIDTCGFTYGFVPSAITVGATGSTDSQMGAHEDSRAYFSNYGDCNDIYAPGWRILSAWRGSDNDTNIIPGTSMATPLVAGVGALILQGNPSLTPAGVREELLCRSIKDKLTGLTAADPNKLLSAVPVKNCSVDLSRINSQV